MSGTLGRVYGGDPQFVHIADGERQHVGALVADYLDGLMRALSMDRNAKEKRLCPGCYMIALYNAALTLAERNGQSRAELCRSMAGAFAALASDDTYNREEIHVAH